MPLLRHEPQGGIRSLDELLGIALALEQEAVRRYTQLAALMERRGETDTVTTFRALIAEEQDHVQAVDGWAHRLGRPAPDAPAFLWRLPPELAASWEELTERTRLTPYQALSLAVVNEQRAFAFYSYIAAAAPDEPVRTHAEALAREELRHAALLRRERRKAYRRERGRAEHKPTRADTPAELERLSVALLSATAAEHGALAARLLALGDGDGAALLTRIAHEERALIPSGSDAAAQVAVPDTAPSCLRAAVAASERLAEAFGDVAAQATDELVLTESLRLQEAVVGHLALLAERIEATG
ncbi:ferritin-like domain-containing protein [Azospirillum brasilense]|uniref:ferritin-like domain-containing protein n=1 Tax=Azospirillum brasilense TaxID=192 RepID=UPI000E67B2BB|nr:ferritin family protein [Azospirillum brasilense]NUB29421.1 rubrerythrin family protein [Azospirillum brasilense]NUB36163.1 rubrerythrin family protein [Azospirillum brasilense]RIW00396.1 rubrerythrin family protein [Azospirillum brasilense]